jgi:hypothetical protein
MIKKYLVNVLSQQGGVSRIAVEAGVVTYIVLEVIQQRVLCGNGQPMI